MSRRTAVLLGLLLSAALAGLGRTTWVRASAVDLSGSPRELAVLGADAAPAVVALALVGLAASLATSLSSAWIRLVTGPVLALVGIGSAAAALRVRADALAASRGSIARSVGVIGGEASAQATAWPLAVLLPALGLVVLGLLVLRQGGRWRRTSRHRRAAAGPVSLDPREDPAGAWDALTLGEDPSAGEDDPQDRGEDRDREQDRDKDRDGAEDAARNAPDATRRPR